MDIDSRHSADDVNRLSANFEHPVLSVATPTADRLLADAKKQVGRSHRIWMRLANIRQDEHPDDSIPIFQRGGVEQLIGTKNNRGYADAVSLMDHVRILLTKAGRPDDFASYGAGVRTAHKLKRNLMKLLDQRGW